MMRRYGLFLIMVCAVASCAPGRRDADIPQTRTPDERRAESYATPLPTSTNPASRGPGRMNPVERPSSQPVDIETPEKDETVDPALPRLVPYAPGIVLNYKDMQVEIAGRVILRQGEIELFAWSRAPVPKEHESILMLDAKPSSIYEALGLIGLTPGTPPRYDWESKTHYPATGDRVDVFVQYDKAGRSFAHSICDWAIDKSREIPLSPRPWVFCGSHRTDNGKFAADIEGTVVTVVDFPSSLLSLAEHHSESNADLWLVANTAAIPEEGTPVTLILRAASASEGDR